MVRNDTRRRGLVFRFQFDANAAENVGQVNGGSFGRRLELRRRL
jgi:hypothetical protein